MKIVSTKDQTDKRNFETIIINLPKNINNLLNTFNLNALAFKIT